MKAIDANHQICDVTILGNLVAKPDIRYLANPVMAITDVVVATTHRWKDKAGNNKEWTSYHHIKVVGKLVEDSLIHANKGDIVLVKGYIVNNKSEPKEVIHATSMQHFPKGFTQSINHITCSASIDSPIRLLNADSGAPLAAFDVSIHHFAYAEHKQTMVAHQVSRPVQVWGQQAKYLAEHGKEGATVIIEGRISYANNQQKSQQIDASNVHVLPK
ncbi:single-stranded DNA-binding protein [Thalassotalea euphylliae]|uniref:single-stranded DNA-binding protein n=1 Tax=Thalassotalea euphylliae TaxID=1655234 RepID=UPI0036267044